MDDLQFLSLFNHSTVEDFTRAMEFHDQIRTLISQVNLLDPTAFVDDFKSNKLINRLVKVKFTHHEALSPKVTKELCAHMHSTLWECPTGSYCLSPFHLEKCSQGYYCPKNSIQPNLCCQGFYCPTPKIMELCPSGHYCPIGSIEPVPCLFGNCKLGSHRVSRIYNWVVLGLFIVFIYLINSYFRYQELLKVQGIQTILGHRLMNTGQKPKESRKSTNTKKSTIKFSELSYAIPSGKTILHGVSGEIKANTACCILGPSGAGKTTLLDTLIGKITPNTGHISLNGRLMAEKVGFVPQSDIMIEELTVFQILMHEAMTKLPRSLPYEKKVEQVIETIELLQLQDVVDCRAGSTSLRSISGGQKKRVNIGMELVGNPDVLVLDEPTSGLDTSTGTRLCNFLKEMCEFKSMTVISVLHSPSTRMFQNFDQLILMGKGGRVAFMGSTKLALPYFEKLGFVKPSDLSASEYLLDIICGNMDEECEIPSSKLAIIWNSFYKLVASKREEAKDYDSIFSEQIEYIPQLVGEWKTIENIESTTESYIKLSWNSLLTMRQSFKQLIYNIHCYMYMVFVSPLIFNSQVGFKGPKLPPHNIKKKKHMLPFWSTFTLCLKRALIQNFVNNTEFFKELLLHIGIGAVLSSSHQYLLYIGPIPDELCKLAPLPLMGLCKAPILDQLAFIGMLVAYTAGFCGSMSVLDTFGAEKDVYLREKLNGLNNSAYFLAKIVADIPRVVITSTCYTLAYITILPTTQSYQSLYFLIFSIYVYAACSGYLISLTFSKQIMSLAVIANHITWAIAFGGVEPPLATIRETIPKPFYYLWEISAPRWIAQAFYLTESVARSYLDPNKLGVKFYGYESDTVFSCFKNIYLISIGWLVVAYFTLKSKK
jgi:ABC-type multidrug transport system ATPase subunit